MGSAAIVLAGGWSAGIVLGALFGPAPWIVLVPGALAAMVAAWLAPGGAVRLLALASVALLLGGVRVAASAGPGEADPLASYAGDAILTGRIVEAPLARGSRIEAVVEVDGIGRPGDPSIARPDQPHPRVLLRVSYLRATYGDRIETSGRLSRPRSRPGFPHEQILARQRIFWVVDAGGARVLDRAEVSLTGVLGELRGQFEANTRALLPEPHASLVAGIVFGARVGLPPDLKADMAATGTSHLTAVSGANVAMVAGAALVLARGAVDAAPASALAIVAVWLYTILVGAPPSAQRAATMATFALLAVGLGRQPDTFAALMLAVAAMLAWDTGLAFDLGFQLSVVATAGLVLLAPSIEGWFGRLPGVVRGQLGIAIAAQIATLPLILSTFQRLSLVSLPANVLAAPLIPPMMVTGAAIALLGWIPWLDTLLGWIAWLLASALLTVIQTAADVPGGTLAVGRSPAWLPLGWYAILGCWAAAGSADVAALGLRSSWLKTTAVVGAALLPVLLLVRWPTGVPDDAVRVVLLDTEPAAVLVRLPAGGTALLTTAVHPRGLAASLGAHLDLHETGVDLEIGPAGVRSGVSLLAVGAPADGAANSVDRNEQLAGQEPFRPENPIADAAATTRPLVAGDRLTLDDRVTVVAIEARRGADRDALDLAVVVDGVVLLLPGPGGTGSHLDSLDADLPTVAILPANAVSWARSLAPRRWLFVVGEPLLERSAAGSSVPFLARREHGAVELTIQNGTATVQSERCPAGLACAIDLPPPRLGPVIDDAADRGEARGTIRSTSRQPTIGGRV